MLNVKWNANKIKFKTNKKKRMTIWNFCIIRLLLRKIQVAFSWSKLQDSEIEL